MCSFVSLLISKYWMHSFPMLLFIKSFSTSFNGLILMNTLMLLEWLFWFIGNWDKSDIGFNDWFSNSFLLFFCNLFDDNLSSFIVFGLFLSCSIIFKEFIVFILSDLFTTNFFSELLKLFLFIFFIYFLDFLSVTGFDDFLDILYDECDVNELVWPFFFFNVWLFIFI